MNTVNGWPLPKPPHPAKIIRWRIAGGEAFVEDMVSTFGKHSAFYQALDDFGIRSSYGAHTQSEKRQVDRFIKALENAPETVQFTAGKMLSSCLKLSHY